MSQIDTFTELKKLRERLQGRGIKFHFMPSSFRLYASGYGIGEPDFSLDEKEGALVASIVSEAGGPIHEAIKKAVMAAIDHRIHRAAVAARQEAEDVLRRVVCENNGGAA